MGRRVRTSWQPIEDIPEGRFVLLAFDVSGDILLGKKDGAYFSDVLGRDLGKPSHFMPPPMIPLPRDRQLYKVLWVISHLTSAHALHDASCAGLPNYDQQRLVEWFIWRLTDGWEKSVSGKKTLDNQIWRTAYEALKTFYAVFGRKPPELKRPR